MNDKKLEVEFLADILDLTRQWVELGIDPDDFLKCALCREFFIDPDNDLAPRAHCENTEYILRTPEGVEVRRGRGWADIEDITEEAMTTRGRLFGISIDGKEVRMAFYDRELVIPDAEPSGSDSGS